MTEKCYLREEVIGTDSVDKRAASKLEKAGIQGLSNYDDDGYAKVLFTYRPGLLNIFRKPLPKLPGHLRRRIELVVGRYGGMTPDQLEGAVYEILWMDRERKIKYFGYYIATT